MWIVATVATPDPTPLAVIGITAPPSLADVTHILHRNALVLAAFIEVYVSPHLLAVLLP